MGGEAQLVRLGVHKPWPARHGTHLDEHGERKHDADDEDKGKHERAAEAPAKEAQAAALEGEEEGRDGGSARSRVWGGR